MLGEGKGLVKTAPACQETEMQRPRHTELVVDPHLAQWAWRAITGILALLGCGLGFAIILGGAERFSGVSYSVAQSVPGSPGTWGWSILLCGLCSTAGLALGRPLLVGIAMMLSGCWSLLFASAFAIATFSYTNSNSTAAWMYGAAAFISFVVAGTYIATARRKD